MEVASKYQKSNDIGNLATQPVMEAVSNNRSLTPTTKEDLPSVDHDRMLRLSSELLKGTKVQLETLELTLAHLKARDERVGQEIAALTKKIDTIDLSNAENFAQVEELSRQVNRIDAELKGGKEATEKHIDYLEKIHIPQTKQLIEEYRSLRLKAAGNELAGAVSHLNNLEAKKSSLVSTEPNYLKIVGDLNGQIEVYQKIIGKLEKELGELDGDTTEVEAKEKAA